MHHRSCFFLVVGFAVSFANPVPAGDEDTIKRLREENAELKKLNEILQKINADEREAKTRELIRAKSIIDDLSKKTDDDRKKARELAEQEKVLYAKRIAEFQKEANRYSKDAHDNADLAKKAQIIAEATLKEIEFRRTEAKELLEFSKKTKADAIKASEESLKLKEMNVALEIELKAMRERSLRLEQRLVELEKTFREPLIGKNPPPVPSVRGKVLKVDDGGLVLISIGADTGIAAGQTLEVFRLGQSPAQARYVGKVTIVKVEAKQSVAKFSGLDKKLAPMAGDEVASRIGSEP